MMAKEADWDECIDSNNAYPASLDFSKIKSLIKTANARIIFLDKLIPDESNIRFLFESYYSSLLEYTHALVLSKKIKVRNHICLGYYLRDVLKRDDLFRMFDECRYNRNSIVYYGTEPEFEKTKKNIKQIKLFIQEIDKLINKGDKN